MIEEPRWRFLDILLIYIAIMGIGIAASLLPVKLWTNEMQYFMYGYMVQFLATIGMIYLVVIIVYKAKWSDLGLRSASSRDIGFYGVMGGFLLIMMVMVFGFVLKYLQPELEPQAIEQMLRSVANLKDWTFIVVAAVILAPVSEEIFYRGMIYPLFRNHLGPFWGAVLAGLIFGMAHWDVWRTIPLAIGGAVLCYIYEKSDSIFVPMVAHGVWNGVMCLLIYLSLTVGSA